MTKRIGITSIGAYVPDRILSNADLEKMVDTTDTWITERTGIKERRLAADDVYSHDLAVEAARRCLEATGRTPDMVISSTCTPGRMVPYHASIVSNRLGLTNLAAFDLNAACSGMIYGLGLAKNLLENSPETYRHILITAGEKMSMVTDYTDRNSCVLFGDAGSALLVSSGDEGHEVLYVELGIDASGSEYVSMGGKNDEYMFRQDGRQVYRFAVTIMNRMIDRLMERAGLNPETPFYVIPHQANLRMLQSVAAEKKIPFDRFITNIDKYGNTSSASIGLALEEAWRQNRFQPGDYLFLIGFGAGLSWGGAVIRW